jgi:hypothetical protein
MVTNRLLNEDDVHENGKDMVIAMKDKPNKFVIASISQFQTDILKRDGQYWTVDEGPVEAAYVASAKQAAAELSAYFNEVRAGYDQELQRERRNAEATAARIAVQRRAWPRDAVYLARRRYPSPRYHG